MSVREKIDQDEWQLLLDVPMMVGAAVMVAGKSGLGTMKESFALAQHSIGAMKKYPDNALIQDIVEARFKLKEKASIESFSSPMLKLTPEEFGEAVTEKCTQVNALLADKASADEASGYKQWIEEIADAVAHAAKEGGFLGFGGERYSEAEKQTVAKIQSALNIT